ncbi:MAG: VWA domain-containing protein, partial [Planctomycetota bacterium]
TEAAALLTPELAKTHRVKLFVGSDRVRSVADFAPGEAVRPADVAAALREANPRPTGNYSNLGESVEDVLSRQENVKLAALFFLTDGRRTGGDDLSAAARQASQRGVPVHTLGFGTADPLPDLALRDLIAPPEANINDVMTFQVTVANTLRPNLRAELKVFQDDSEKPFITRPLVLPAGEKRVSISTIPRTEGEIKYTLTLPTFPDEFDHDNNTASFHVTVVKRKLKVLFIAGSPTMEFHHIVPSLIRDNVMNVSCYLQSAAVNAVQQGNVVIDELPGTPSQWDRYDVVVLYDVDPNKLTNEQESGLEQLVRDGGGGLLFIAGRVHGMGALLQVRGAKMRTMLPVEINKNLHPKYDEYFSQPFHIERTREGKMHPVLLFAPSTRKNNEVWRTFADLEFFWNHPIMGLKRAAVPLLVKQRQGTGAAARECIMALMKYGKGSTVFLGVHTMWRWRFPAESFDYGQFWAQTIRYLGEYRMLGAQRQVTLNTDKKIYAPGETVRITLSVLDPAMVNQLRTEQVFATVTDESQGEYKVMMKSSPRDPATMHGGFAARRLGEHEVRVRHVLAEDLAAKRALFDETTHFGVRMQSLEFTDTRADLAGLRALAESTGGTALDHGTMAAGLKKAAASVDPSPQFVPHESYDDLWDRWYILAVLLGLGTVELWFRRNWGLL